MANTGRKLLSESIVKYYLEVISKYLGTFHRPPFQTRKVTRTLLRVQLMNAKVMSRCLTHFQLTLLEN